MPKSKHAPALFELIDNHGEKKAADKLALPKWLKTTPQPEQPTAPDPAGSGAQPSVLSPASPSSRNDPATRAASQSSSATFGPARPATPGPAGESDGLAPVARVRSGRIELALNPTNAILVGGALLIVVLCVYLIGRGTGTRGETAVQVAGTNTTAVDDVRAAMDQPANGKVLDPSRSATTLMAAKPGPRPESGQKTDKPEPQQAAVPTPAPGESNAPAGGPNRIVIESFKLEHQKSAEHVRKWLMDNYGLKTELKSAGERIWLVTSEGIDLEKPGQREYRDKLIEDLKSLGESCARELASKNLTPYRITGPYTRRFDK